MRRGFSPLQSVFRHLHRRSSPARVVPLSPSDRGGRSLCLSNSACRFLPLSGVICQVARHVARHAPCAPCVTVCCRFFASALDAVLFARALCLVLYCSLSLSLSFSLSLSL